MNDSDYRRNLLTGPSHATLHQPMAAQARPGGRKRQRLLFVHFGDAPLRGSERCLLNVLEAFSGQRADLTLWCNQSSLAEAAKPLVGEVVVSDCRPSFGFGYATSFSQAITSCAASLKEGAALVRRKQVDLIFCNGLAPCQWMVPVSLVCGVPLLAHLHADYLPRARVLSLGYGASGLIGVSRFCIGNFAADAYPAASSKVVLNGVAVPAQTQSRCATRDALGIAEDAFVVVSIGMLIDRKRVDILVEAIRALPAEMQASVRLLIVGDGPCMPDLQAQAAGLPIVFAGWRTDIGNLLAASDCIAVSADGEAFGLTVIEAAALRLPAVVADSGGLPEVVVHGVSGLVFPAGSVSACAAHIQHLMLHPDERLRLGANAFERYQAHFTVGHMTTQVHALVEQHLGSSRPLATSLPARHWRLLRLTARNIVRRLLRRPV